MNLFDELGGITPRTEGGLNRQGDNKYQQDGGGHQLHTENDLEEAGRNESEKEDVPTGWMRFIKPAYYVQYFQVSQKEVVQRIKYSITIPYQDSFLDLTHSNPDFYGPFWILTTLIMLLSFIGNFSNYLLSIFSSGNFQKYFFKLEFVREAIILVYAFGFGVPTALYFTIKLNAEKLEVGLHHIICLYGYALFCFLPAVTACILPLSILQWLCLLYGLGNSTLFLRTSLLKRSGGVSQVLLISIIIGAQFIFILCLKFIFLELLEGKK